MKSRQLWFVAGPNGGGKSTFGTMLAEEFGGAQMTILNPDEFSEKRRLGFDRARVPGWIRRSAPWRSIRSAWVDWPAVRRVERTLNQRIEAGEPVALETVLSTRKYVPHIHDARRRGYLIGIVFVALPTAGLHVDRVRMRVQAGGHGVDERKIHERWRRSHEVLGEVAPLLDRLIVFNNQDPEGRPELVCERTAYRGAIEVHSRSLPEVLRTLHC